MLTKSILLLLAASAFAADTIPLETRKEKVRSHLSRGEFSVAAEQAKKMNREIPDDVSIYQLLASAELGLGNYEKAEQSIQWMLDLRIGKADAAGWLLVAQLRDATGDFDGAIDAVNLAFSRIVAGQRPDAQSLLLYAAKLQMLAGKLDNAEKILKGMPASGEETLGTLAQLRIAQQRQAEAIEILRPLTQPKNLYQLAVASGKPEDYQAFERTALLRKKDADNANRELILYYAGVGKRPNDAVKLARQEADVRHDILTLDALAIALQEAGSGPEAVSTMKLVLAVGTRNPEILRHAALLGVQ